MVQSHRFLHPTFDTKEITDQNIFLITSQIVDFNAYSHVNNHIIGRNTNINNQAKIVYPLCFDSLKLKTKDLYGQLKKNQG
jgi:hypothetical protein